MDEVDKIIVQSLRQIGCSIDDDAFNMSNFTPELLVCAVCCCLKEIKPNAVLPRSLPPGMAQRFTVATTLAEMCASCGYRSDIGYQTFLYPNSIDVRRLFMFLIEQLPKDKGSAPESNVESIGGGDYELLLKEIKEKMLLQLQTPWVPQYCRGIGHKRTTGCSSQNIKFSPQLNLNIPDVKVPSKEVQHYMQQQAPNIFQQTAAEDYDLISSVLHRNALDANQTPDKELNYMQRLPPSIANIISTKVKNDEETMQTKDETVSKTSTLSPLDKLTENVNVLKTQNDAMLAERKIANAKISSLKSQQTAAQAEIERLRKDAKIHERTCVVLENPKENVSKLEGLIHAAQAKRKTLEQQWQQYRQPMLEQRKELQTSKQARNVQDVMDLRQMITQLEQTLREKIHTHAQLNDELKKVTLNAAPRKEYTRRILEFIGNIRKQRNDIFKVLDDTRDLQKQLNSVSAQLQRQFNYTDDLLFQSAKHDANANAKRAYVLLASLHAACNELIELVAQTGNITKEIRDLEVQIDREKLKNIAQSLEQISADIRNFENVIKTIQSEIRKVENEIIPA